MQEEYIVDLLERMAHNDEIATVYPSNNSISWKAYREAEQIQSSEYIPVLVKLIQKNIRKCGIMLISYLESSWQNMKTLSP